jgi:hypothetical protein
MVFNASGTGAGAGDSAGANLKLSVDGGRSRSRCTPITMAAQRHRLHGGSIIAFFVCILVMAVCLVNADARENGV